MHLQYILMHRRTVVRVGKPDDLLYVKNPFIYDLWAACSAFTNIKTIHFRVVYILTHLDLSKLKKKRKKSSDYRTNSNYLHRAQVI